MNPKLMNVIPPEFKLDENSKPRVITYDFRRPDRFSKEQMRSFMILNDHYKDMITSRLSQLLRMHVEIKLPRVDQLTLEEFSRSLPENPAIGIIDMKPIKTHSAISIDPALVQSFMNRIFGGNGVPDKEDVDRTISELEAVAMKKIFGILIEQLSECWEFILPLQAELKSLETIPKFIQIVPPPEMVILASMECVANGVSGYINFCVPFLTIEPVLYKFSAQYFYGSLPKHRNEKAAARIPSLPLDTKVYYETEKLPLSEINEILAGKEIILDPEKKYSFSAGSVPLLKLKPDRDDCFDIISDSTLTRSIEAFLQSEPESKGNAGDQLSAFRSEFSSLIDHIDKRFGALEQKQNALADQFSCNDMVDLGEEPSGNLSARPFSFITKGHIADLFTMCSWENPQAVAVILSYIDPTLSASLLEMFGNEKQANLVARVSCLDMMHPQLLAEMENYYYRKLKDMASHETMRAGGLNAAIQILNMSSRSVERNVVENFENNLPDLAEQIKQNMFVFEDIVLLDQKACGLVVSKAKRRDLLLALKMTDEQVKKYIRTCVSEKEWSEIETGLNELGRVRLTEIEAAQVAVVNTIRMLEDNGEIIVARMNEIVE